MVTQEELEKMSPEEVAALQKQNCIFCKIVAGEVPGAKIFENDSTISILDINPATRGHALVLPKEHYPILPIVPPDTFKKLFLDAKTIATSIKKKTLAGSTSIFIANGAVAGQQAPHFLFHIIPDHKFTYPAKESLKAANDALFDSLKNNLGIMMANHAKREGKIPSSPASSPPGSPTVPPMAPPTPEQVAAKREQIAKIIQENPDVRNLLRNDVESFKKTIEQHDQLKALFQGVDVEALSKSLQSLPDTPVASPTPTPSTVQQEAVVQKEFESPLEPQKVEEPQPLSTPQSIQPSQPKPAPVPETPEQNSIAGYAQSSSSQQEKPPEPLPKPEVFLGADPLAQKDKVFAYFKEKPKAQELLMNDPEQFKELLATREDIQPIFQEVNLEKLSQKLNEAFPKEEKGDARE